MIDLSKEKYEILFEKKKDHFSNIFNDATIIDFFSSPFRAYRHRAEFGVIEVNKKLFYSMTVDGKKQKIHSFPVASEKIQSLMEPLISKINKNLVISEKLFQIEFQSSRAEEIMITLIYHKFIDEYWEYNASEIASELGISIIGRSKNQKVIIGKDFVKETYNFSKERYELNQFEQCFSQTNPFICDDMINWVYDNCSPSNDVMELHCGQGTFTILLSNLYRKVLATENSRPSIYALKENIKINNKENIYFGRLSGKETIEAFTKKRTFRRLKDIDLEEFNLDTIFLDPPREGLDQFTKDALINFDNVIYLSCGFESFKNDIQDLENTHEIEKLAMFDQFPYTDHIESGAILKKIAQK